MGRDLERIFSCDDQSALIHNYVASEDPPPGAWSHHSAPQSPLGKISFPEVLTIPRGEVYTRGGEGGLVEAMLTRRRWVPWHYRGEGRGLSVERTVNRDVFLSRLRVTSRPALLLLQLSPAAGLKIDVRRRGRRALECRWENHFVIQLEFSGKVRRIDLNDDAAPLKRRFAGFDDVQINEPHCTGWAWNHLRSLWVGVEFDGELEFRFAVGRPGRLPRRVEFDTAVNHERQRWEEFFEQVPELKTTDRVLRDTYYFAWQTIWANRCDGGCGSLAKPFISPARLSYGSQWWWDEAFHTAIIRHLGDGRQAYGLLENFWSAQGRGDWIPGMLSFKAAVEDRKKSGEFVMSMQPPVIGLALQLLKDKPGWPREVRPMYEGLRRHVRWLLDQRDADRDGLCEYHHSFDSSADQTPRWDSQKINPEDVVGPLRPTESVDLNVWLSLLLTNLSEMADQLGDPRAAEQHLRHAQGLFERIERLMWDHRDGFYYDIDGRTHRKIRVKTPNGFMPMLSRWAKPQRVRRLVREHLLNPKEFWCRWPLPSVSLDHPQFDPINMFRGPTWVNVNWMVIEGLSRQGYRAEAKKLARRTVELVGPRYRRRRRLRSPRVWEWYHPHTGQELGNNQYSWTALCVDLILRFLT